MIQLWTVAASIVQVLSPFVSVTATDILSTLAAATCASASEIRGRNVTKLPPIWSSAGAVGLASWSTNCVAMPFSSIPRPASDGSIS
jgi:hypothetical protein